MDPLTALFALHGVINGVGNLAEAHDEVSRKHAIDAARQHIVAMKRQARARRDAASREGNPVAKAAADATLSQLAALERRTDLRRLGDQVDAVHERWRSQRQKDTVAGWAGKVIFGKLGSYFSGGTKTVVSEGGNMGFSSSPSGADRIQVDTEALLASLLEETDAIRPLPSEVGEYLARETYREVLRDNPQLAGETNAEVSAFVCTQAGKELDRLLRSVLTHADVEAVVAAREALCAQNYASGTLDGVGSARQAHPLLTQRQVRLRYTQGGPVEGTFELQLEANDEQLAEFVDGIGEAAGSAAAGALDLGTPKDEPTDPVEVPDEIKGCKLTGKFTFVLEGTHDGDTAMSGTLEEKLGDPGKLKVKCPGRTKELKMDRKDMVKGAMTWSAKDRGADLEVTVLLGDIKFRGNIKSGRGTPPKP